MNNLTINNDIIYRFIQYTSKLNTMREKIGTNIFSFRCTDFI